MTGASGPYSIVMVTWQCAEHLRRLIPSLVRHAPAAELIVIDNASDDDPESAARAFKGDVTFIQLDANLGYGAAANVGVEVARGDAVVLLNPDTELAGPGLEALCGFALRERALAGPRLLDPDGSVQPSAAGPPVGAWPWVGALMPGRIAPAAVRRRTEPWRLARTTEVAWITGACVAGPRDVLEALGPFDPAIHLYGEDMDLGLRAASLGTPSYICPELATVIHHRRGSTSKRFASGPEPLMARNQRLVLQRHFGERREANARRAQRLNLLARSVAKRALRRDAGREERMLHALKRTREDPGPNPSAGSR